MNEESENFIRIILIYSNNIEKFTSLLKNLGSNNIDILIESYSKYVLDTINKYNPHFILIENDYTNNGLTLYEIIKEESNLDSTPVVMLGPEDEVMKLKALKLGALDYLYEENIEEVYIKLLNLIHIGKKLMNNLILDKLTGIYTKKYVENIINKIIQSAIENKYPLTLLLVDIDELNEINYKLGRKNGDEILKSCVDCMKASIKEKDIIFRYSSEEFVLIFNGKTIPKVLDIAKNLQFKINILSEIYGIKVSFSAGISSITAKVTDYLYLITNAMLSLAVAKRGSDTKIYIYDIYANEVKKKNILIVDEEQSISSILSSRYKNKGYELYSAISAENTLEILNNNTIHLLIIDFKLFTDLIDIKNNFTLRIIKIIVISSAKNANSIEFAFKNGVDEYLKKPFSIIELDFKVKKLLS